MSPSIFRENSEKTERWVLTNTRRLAPFLLPSSCIITLVFTSFFLYTRNPFRNITDQNVISYKALYGDGNCDLFNGHWIPDPNGSLYTNSSCSTIPDSKNCMKQGRLDRDFVFWRWKPDGCDLPRLNPKSFLTMLRGKKMNFIGASLARNQMESLLCLLSTEETPTDIYSDADDRNRIWHFPKHDFTLSTSWTKHLVTGNERKDANGTLTGVFDVDTAKVDQNWAKDLSSSDIVVVSGIHWFFRPIVIHRGDEILGCMYCDFPNMAQIKPHDGFKLVYSAVLKHIEGCSKCKENLVTVVRTYSPPHFENGTWNDGGSCGRTSPFSPSQVNLAAGDVERTAQIGQVERVRDGSRSKKKFVALDVTKAMLMRPDGHPNAYWGNNWMKGYNDCVHWCLPGPIDAWNDLLMAMLRQLM